MDLEQENATLKERIAELEEGMRTQKKGLVNLLTIMKEYGGIFLQTYQGVMGKVDAEKDSKDLVKRHFG
jgi:hypothetical protein